MTSIGNKIRTMRKSRSLTQSELASSLGISRSTVAMWERDEREPDFDSLEALADVFNVPLSSLFGDEPIYPVNLSDLCVSTLEMMKRLNTEGQRKVLEYTRDLVATGHYLEDTSAQAV